MSARRTRAAVLGVIGAAIVGPTIAALAYWTMTGGSGGATRADRLSAGNKPTATVIAHSVTLEWLPSTLETRTGVAAGAYEVRRHPGVDGPYDVVENCALLLPIGREGPQVTTGCTDPDVDAGTYRYSVVPLLGDDWQGIEGPLSDPIVVEPPTVLVPEGAYVNAADRTSLEGVILTGFRAGETVELSLLDENNAEIPLATVVVKDVGNGIPDADVGTLDVDPLAVPPTVPDGRYTVVAVSEHAEPVTPSGAVVVDRTVPTLVPPPGIPASWTKDDVPVRLEGSDANGIAHVDYSVDSGPSLRGSNDALVTLTQTGGLTFTATDPYGNTSAPLGVTVQIDKIAPQPGPNTNPTSVKDGTKLSNVPTDTGGSGVARVLFLTCPGAAGCASPTAMAPADETSPYEATVPSSLAEGQYRLIVRVTDVAGNVTDSAPFPLTVDKTAPTVVWTPPTIVGTVATVSATITDPSGVGSVAFAYGTDGTTWTAITPTTGPTANVYSVSWNTTSLDTTVPYLLQVVAKDAPGNIRTLTSGNVDVFGVTSVFTVNRPAVGNGRNSNAAGTPGLIERGDTLTVVWNRTLDVTALCPSWTPAGGPDYTTGLLVRIVDGGAGNDIMRFEGSCGGTNVGQFGSVTLGSGAYVGPNGSMISGNGSNAGSIAYNAPSSTMTFTMPATVSVPIPTVGGPTRLTYVPAPAPLSTGGLVAGSRLSSSAIQF